MDRNRFCKRLRIWLRETIERDTVYTIAVIALGLVPVVLALAAMFVLR
jgi:hypothetical protein